MTRGVSMRDFVVAFFIMMALAPFFSTASAQTTAVRGRVSDPQGGAVMNAVVTLTPDGGQPQTTRSGADGAFSFAQTPAAGYLIQVDAPGFVRWRQRVAAGGPGTALSVTLQIAGVSESVDVVGAAPAILTKPASTGTRLGLTPLETPASIQILTGELVRERGDVSLADARSRAAGVTNASTPGNGGGGVIARGFSGVGSVMQLWDGGQLFVGAGTITFPFDPWTVDRIEVLGGPASVMYGAGAIGGVVNVVPRKPNVRAFENTVKVTGGSQNTFRGALDSTGPLNDRWSYRVDVSQNNSGGWINRDGDSNSTALSGSLRAQTTPTLSFTLSDDYGYQRPERYFGAPTINGQVNPSVRRTNYNIAEADINYKDNWTQLNTEWKPSPRVFVRNNLHALNTDRHWNNLENYTFQPATGLITRASYIEIFHHQRQYGDRTEVILTDNLLGKLNTLSAGFDYNWVRFEHVSNTPFGGSSTVTLADPVPGAFINLTSTFPRYRTHTQQYSGFFEDRLALTGKLSLVGGARIDRYDVDRLDLVANTTASRTFTPPSWRGGVVYSVSPEISLYAQYATANDAVGNFISQSPAQQIFDLTKGRQVEAGFKQSLRNGRAEWTVAGYQIVKKNLVVPTPDNPAVSQQVGQQSSKGVEVTAAVTLGHGVRVDANAALLQARFDDFRETVAGVVVSRNGNAPPSVPRRTANLWASWTISPGWDVRAGLRYVGERFWNNANTSTAPAYTVLDAGITRKLTNKLTVDARLYNAIDKLYATTFYGNSAAPQWLLGRPRAGEVTLSVKF